MTTTTKVQAPSFIAGLRAAQGAKTQANKKLWAMSVPDFWLPQMIAEQVNEDAEYPVDMFERPFILKRDKTGAVVLRDGEPVLVTHKALSDGVKLHTQLYQAVNQQYQKEIIENNPDGVQKLLADARKAALPFINKDVRDVEAGKAALLDEIRALAAPAPTPRVVRKTRKPAVMPTAPTPIHQAPAANGNVPAVAVAA